jgi:hypothetical protein
LQLLGVSFGIAGAVGGTAYGITQATKPVTGTVELNLYKGNVLVKSRTSPLSLYDEAIASMEGGGSYDRFLARSNAWTIALLHRGELTSEMLPVEPHDQKIKAAATPEIIVRF